MEAIPAPKCIIYGLIIHSRICAAQSILQFKIFSRD